MNRLSIYLKTYTYKQLNTEKHGIGMLQISYNLTQQLGTLYTVS